MKEMDECLGPVLPWMRSRILTDEAPMIKGSVRTEVITLERLLIVLRSVPKNQVEGSLQLGALDKQLPIEVTNFMSEVTK